MKNSSRIARSTAEESLFINDNNDTLCFLIYLEKPEFYNLIMYNYP